MHEIVELSGITKQIMPGPSGDLEEWQTLEVNVTLGFASGDIDLLGLPFPKVTLEPRHYLYNVTLSFKAKGQGFMLKLYYLAKRQRFRTKCHIGLRGQMSMS